jgi:hypothetical protein
MRKWNQYFLQRRNFAKVSLLVVRTVPKLNVLDPE